MFKKYLFVALATVVGLTACSDDDDNYVPGEQDSANKAGVYVVSGQASTIELDPNDDTSITVELARQNTSGAITVPLSLEGSDAVFSVSDAVFADGESTATAKVSFPDAEVGKSYTLKLTVPTDYVAIYKQLEGDYANYGYVATVTRVKWNDLGEGQWYDGFWYGFLTNVTVQQRDDKPEMYRIASPYTNELVTSYGEQTGTYSSHLVFTLNDDNTVSWDNYLYINTTNSSYGVEMLGWYPSALSSSLADNDASSKAVLDSEGNILYFDIEPYWYMSGVGGYGLYPLYLGFPGTDLSAIIGE